MNLQTYIILFIFFLLIYIDHIDNVNKVDNTDKKLKWYKCKDDKYTNLLFINALTERDYERTNDNDWDIYLYCKNDFSNKTLNNIKITNNNQKIYYVDNNAYLGNKRMLWSNLDIFYGRAIAETIMPSTYIFPKDHKIFLKRHVVHSYYILKNEKQRQEGLRLTNNIGEVRDYDKNGYKFIQKYISDPLLYKGHKLNFRIYLVVICKNNKVTAYIYNDGITTYAAGLYDPNNITFNNTISSFYTGKKLYNEGYPIIISELKKEMNLPWSTMMKEANKKIKMVIDATKDKITAFKRNVTTFQLFGVDIMFDTKLNPFILEINVGPGMKPYNESDTVLRTNLMHNIIDLTNEKVNNFIKI
jgi:tubulin polyglutamylase TTLL1